MIKKPLSLLLIICLLLLAGCARQEPLPEQVLSALTDAEVGLPAGQVYLSSAPEDSEQYLPSDLISALYGQGEPPWQLALIEDYGIWLSNAQHPCEFAVFRCYARSDTDLVAAMCHARLDALCVHYKNTEYAPYLQNAKVAVIGKYVLLLVSSDAQHALQIARQTI